MTHGSRSIPHHKVPQLMPAFMHGRLDSQLQRQIQEHIASCPSCARVHREDLELYNTMEQVPPGVEMLLTSKSRERNRMRLMHDLGTSDTSDVPGTGSRRFRQAGKDRRFRLSALAATLVALAVGILLVPGNTDREVTYETHSTIPVQPLESEGPTYRVVFQSAADPKTVQGLLEEMGAVIVAGPSAAGVYTLAFPAPSADTVLRRLRQMPEIALAEKSVHNDG